MQLSKMWPFVSKRKYNAIASRLDERSAEVARLVQERQDLLNQNAMHVADKDTLKRDNRKLKQDISDITSDILHKVEEAGMIHMRNLRHSGYSPTPGKYTIQVTQAPRNPSHSIVEACVSMDADGIPSYTTRTRMPYYHIIESSRVDALDDANMVGYIHDIADMQARCYYDEVVKQLTGLRDILGRS